MKKEQRYLISFDLDGTLLFTNKEGKDSFLKGFNFYLPPGHAYIDEIDISFKGGVDFKIFCELCKMFNIKANKTLFENFSNKYLEFFKNYSTPSKWIIYEGIFEFLSSLRQKGIECTVVSGNLYDTGIFKLKSANLYEYFSFFAFNNFEKNRINIMKKIMKYSDKNNFYYIAHVGDSISDIQSSFNFSLPSIYFADKISDMDVDKLLFQVNTNLNILKFSETQDETIKLFILNLKNKISKSFKLVIFSSYSKLKQHFDEIFDFLTC